MKKNLLITVHTIAAAVLVLFLVNGCGERRGGSGGTLESAEKTSFDEVTAHLDPGGNLYLYLGTEQWLDGLSGKIAGYRNALLSVPELDDESRQNVGRLFDVVTRLVKDSGVEEISGIGMSSIALEGGFYHSKALVHHYPGEGDGFVWKLLGEKAHPLTGLDLLPANTALASFSDTDLPLLWSVIRRHVDQSGFPEASAFLAQMPGEFERATGLQWDRVLGSLGGEVGLIVTLDESRMIAVPLPTAQPLELPEPGLMIVVKVNDDTIFNRIEQELNKNPEQLVRVDREDLKMRTLPVPLPLPIQLRPTIAASGGYLFLATTDAMVEQVLAVRSGTAPGLKSTEEFKRLSRDIPEQGNQFTFLSQRFGQTVVEIQRQALEMSAGGDPARREWFQSLLRPEQAAFSYSVSGNTEQGWLTVGNGNQHAGKVLVASAVIAPLGLLSAIAVPNFIKARETSQQNACINNLRQLDGAKQQWALETRRTNDAVPTQADLQPYLSRARARPSCPAGGEYTIGRVNEQPTCSVAGHSLIGR